MIVNLINKTVYTGVLVAFAAACLLFNTYLFFNINVREPVVITVLFGTLFIYNTDHIRGLARDKSTEPERVSFIKNNIIFMKVLTTTSLLISSLAGLLFLSAYEILLLIPVILLGLFHRILKKNLVLKSIYITVSWTIVVAVLPTLHNTPSGIYWYTVIVASVLFSNAYAYSAAKSKKKESTYQRLPVIVSASGCMLTLIAPADFIYILTLPLLTLSALLISGKKDIPEHLFLDGSLLAGAVISMILIQF